MNEQDLKQIWRTEETIPLQNIDMEYIEQFTINTQNSLQKLSRKELIWGLIFSALFVFDSSYSDNFYPVLSAVAAVWIYIFWKKRREVKFDELKLAENIKLFLINKEKRLKREIRIQRIFGSFSIFIFSPIFNMLNGSLNEKASNLMRYIVSLIISAVVIQIFSEFYIRRNYIPILEDLRYLIEQFDEDDKS